MKYLFNLFNIICLTASISLLVDTLYSYIDSSLSVSTYDNFSVYNDSLYKSDKSENGGADTLQSEKRSVKLASYYDIIHKRDIFKTSIDVNSNKKDDKDKDKGFDSISEQQLAALKITNLKLKLWGTATGGEESENYAVIENDRDKRQELYKKGDKIEDAVIKKILRLSVILSRNGTDERLDITDDNISNKKARQPLSTQSVNLSSSQGEVTSEDKIEMSIKRSMIDESMRDINALMNQVRIRPHFTGGNADGILLYGIKQDSMFKEMGIQNGDIIMGVDGKEINSVEDAISLYDRLKNSSAMKMQIRRRGQIKEITYNVEQ